MLSEVYHYTDFTEESYKALLKLARSHYKFSRFVDSPPEKHVVWRHDIDFSMHRALKLARMEAEEGIMSTYFIYPHAIYYNFLNNQVMNIARTIAELGHDIGLHFDPMFYENCHDNNELEKKILIEKNLIQDFLGIAPVAISIHNYGCLQNVDIFNADVLCGMVNTYGKTIREKYTYVSDSNGIWRFERLLDVLKNAKAKYLHVLTHPAWWTPEAMSPRARIARCIEGYANAMNNEYDQQLSIFGRPNIQ